MSVLRTAMVASRLQKDDPAWIMLRGRNAAVAVAILGRHLGAEQRRLAAPVLFDRIEEDLEELRGNGLDLPQTAQAYCADWRNDGILIRRTADRAREETLELSEGALTAIRFVIQLAEPRPTVTESRLATILDRLRTLARDTDPDVETRLAALRAERDRIDEQIDRVQGGDVDVLHTEQAVERIRDILSLAEEVPADFARVRAQMESLNRNLRERLIEQDGPRSSVLENIFRGVDLLAESEAGRSFSGFYALLLDPEHGLEFEDSVAGIMDRDFVEQLSPTQLRVLRRLLPTLQDRSSEIHAVMTAFSRSLRRFVQSQQLQHERLISRRLREALGEAMSTSTRVKPYVKTDMRLDLTSVPLDSVASLNLHNPADFEAAQDVVEHAAAPVDVEELRALARASEIDMAELEDNVNAVLVEHGAATIAEVLDWHPATQGVASVVGLLVLAEEHATALDGREDVTWESSSANVGVSKPNGPLDAVATAPRRGTVGRYLFSERIET
ncbi:DUF3375 domain-containing protein [Arthrobacter monumenti]